MLSNLSMTSASSNVRRVRLGVTSLTPKVGCVLANSFDKLYQNFSQLLDCYGIIGKLKVSQSPGYSEFASCRMFN